MIEWKLVENKYQQAHKAVFGRKMESHSMCSLIESMKFREIEPVDALNLIKEIQKAIRNGYNESAQKIIDRDMFLRTLLEEKGEC